MSEEERVFRFPGTNLSSHYQLMEMLRCTDRTLSRSLLFYENTALRKQKLAWKACNDRL